jgi:nucleoside phosphorylase
MKILIVDDNVNRTRKIIDFLVTSIGISRESIIDKRTSSEARQYLQGSSCDLLILDILIPHRIEDEPSMNSAVALLTEISEGGVISKPGKIIGLSAYADAAQQASRTFVEHTWTIIESDEISDGWLKAIGNCVTYLRGKAGQHNVREYGVDVLIITALREPEMAAVKKLDWLWTVEQPMDDATFYSQGLIKVDEHTELSVVAAVSDRVGMVSSAITTTKLITKFAPRLCIVPGICAGIMSKADIGDVILAECSWDYQSGKATLGEGSLPGFEIEPHQISVDAFIKARFDQLAGDANLLHSIWQDWPDRPNHPPKGLRGPIASGSAVFADGDTARQILGQNRKTRGVEMEIYGVYAACAQSQAPRPLAMGVKAVCDFADSEKHDHWQAYAAFVSARVMDAFLRRFGSALCR